MNCMTSIEHCRALEAPLPAPGAVQHQRARNRQAAVSCLQAAATTTDPVERSFLRRYAAGLILPRQQVRPHQDWLETAWAARPGFC